jgi:PII-like signaling protein
VIVDTAAKIESAMPAIDEMVGNGMVVISDVDVVFYRGAPA